MSEKISIAEARARRADPAWRRRHQMADLRGIALVVLLLVVPPVAGALSRSAGVAVWATVLVGGPAALWWRGPVVGLERRSALLVAVPGLNLFVFVPAVWRLAHLGLQRWQGPLEPRWSDRVWLVVAPIGVLCWLASVASLVRSLA